MTSNPFIQSLFASPVFWSQTVGFGAAAVAGLVLSGLVLRWGLSQKSWQLGRIQTLRDDNRGVAAIMDFTLVLPIFVMIILLTLQLALMANASLIVHYSAYSAARSAKSQLLDFDHAFLDLDCCSIDLVNKAQGVMSALTVLNEGRPDVDEKVFAAAAWPLVSLAPSSRDIAISAVGGGGQGTSKSSYRRIDDLGLRTVLQKQDIKAGRTDLLLRKAAYAYSNAYLQVDYGSPIFSSVKELWEQRANSPSLSQVASSLGVNAHYAAVVMGLADKLEASGYSVTTITSLPVYAEVKFYFPLLVPWASFFFDQSNLMATQPGRWMSARVELL